MRYLLSFGVLIAYISMLPVIRLTGFGHQPQSSNESGIGASRLIGAGGYLEQLFAIVASSIRIPVVYRYERDVAIALHCVRGKTFLDIGANQGYYCCLLRGNFTLLLAVEPALDNIRVMQRVFRLSNVRAKIFPVAVTDREGFANLVLAPHSSSHRVATGNTGGNLQSQVRVSTVAVESFVKKYGQIDLVKVDVEGAEWLVLEGAEGVVERVRRWSIELHESSKKEELEAWMKSHDYRFIWLDSNHLYSWRA